MRQLKGGEGELGTRQNPIEHGHVHGRSRARSVTVHLTLQPNTEHRPHTTDHIQSQHPLTSNASTSWKQQENSRRIHCALQTRMMHLICATMRDIQEFAGLFPSHVVRAAHFERGWEIGSSAQQPPKLQATIITGKKCSPCCCSVFLPRFILEHHTSCIPLIAKSVCT